MQIWVDADACPQVIKEILFRAADRVQVVTTLVANTTLRTPPSAFIKTVRVRPGFDVADHWIVQQLQSGDLVITADIPLAAEVITRGAHALDPRGEMYSEDNVRERLAVRNLMQEQLLFTGISTNSCVEGTARDAADRGFRCVIVEDGCGAASPALHEATCANFARLLGRVEGSAEVLRELEAAGT